MKTENYPLDYRQPKVIGVCGFGSTGSSAVHDYLLEFENTMEPGRAEFDWAYVPDGLLDLEYHLFHPYARTMDSIIAIKRFMDISETLAAGYSGASGMKREDFLDSVRRLVDSITQASWHWYRLKDHSIWERLKYKYLQKVIMPREKRTKEINNGWPQPLVRFSVCPENFMTVAQQHIREVLCLMGWDEKRDLIVDMAFSSCLPEPSMRFFPNAYAIIVDRDPRDIFIHAHTVLMGRNHWMPFNVKDFCTYYRGLRNSSKREDSERILHVSFCDLVYRYEETTSRIRQFLGYGENSAPNTLFIPELSKANTQEWLRFPQFADDIRHIEQQLPEYLYDFTSCEAPDANAEMFWGRSKTHNFTKR